MFSLKVYVLTLALVIAQASPITSKNDLTKSPSNSKQLPLQAKDVHLDPKENKLQEVTSLPWMENEKGEKFHSLSKRFIPAHLLNVWASPLKQSPNLHDTEFGSQRSVSNSLQPSAVDDTLADYRIINHDNIDITYDPGLMDYVRGLTISKRFLDLLPAKVPRRKDLPPRIGEETAPKFGRAFNQATYKKSSISSARVMDTLNDLPSSNADNLNYVGDSIDLIGNRFWDQTFNVDNPTPNINLNGDDLQSNGGEFYSTSDDYSPIEAESDYSDDVRNESESTFESIEDGELEIEETDEERTLTSSQQSDQFTTRFKTDLTQLLHQLLSRNSG